MQRTLSLIAGNGIGPEIAESVKLIFSAARVPIKWEMVDVRSEDLGNGRKGINPKTIETLKRNKVGLKGPLATPIGRGHPSLNLALRKELGLYANVRPSLSIPGFKAGPYKDVDLLIIRENTEGEYSGMEHQIAKGIMQSIKLITKEASERIGRFAFNFCATSTSTSTLSPMKSVTVVHKAAIMRASDGLFLKSVRDVHAKEFPEIPLNEVSLDKIVLQLVNDPQTYKGSVLVMPNLYGDILSDMCAGFIGGLGLTPSANIGQDGVALFEAVHGTAPDLVGKDIANPTALLLSSVMMLRHLKMDEYAAKIENAVLSSIKAGNRTGDLGGQKGTKEFTDVICRLLSQ